MHEEEIDFSKIEIRMKVKVFLKEKFEENKDLIKKNTDKIILFFQFSLVAVLFFGLGLLYNDYRLGGLKELNISQNKQIMGSVSQFQAKIGELEGEVEQAPVVVKDSGDFLFVASKNGKTYYKVSCKNRISEKNKIYFKSEEDAASVGLRRSKTCFK